MINLNRRDFVKSATLAFGSVLLFPSCLKQTSQYRFFNSDEASCIIALCEQIIPGDESPGATDARVIYYIDRQLIEVFLYNQHAYRTGIKNLQKYCSLKFGKSFQDLKFSDQTTLLQVMEANQLTDADWPDGKPVDFFNMLRSHTMQGFYGSPIHGGNKNYMSFEMLRIDYPLVIGQNRYRS